MKPVRLAILTVF